jgi:hypothetical protein
VCYREDAVFAVPDLSVFSTEGAGFDVQMIGDDMPESISGIPEYSRNLGIDIIPETATGVTEIAVEWTENIGKFPVIPSVFLPAHGYARDAFVLDVTFVVLDELSEATRFGASPVRTTARALQYLLAKIWFHLMGGSFNRIYIRFITIGASL